MIYRKISSLIRLWNLLGKNLVAFLKFIYVHFSQAFPVEFKVYLFGRGSLVKMWDRSDFLLFKEIFLHNEYDFGLLKNPKTILDLGANIGFASVYFHLKYPEASIYSFEPDPNTFKLLQDNTRHIPQISAHQWAISDKSGYETFYPNQNKASASFSKRSRSTNEIVIKSVSLQDALEIIGIEDIDILKFDIEGAEGKVFASDSLDKYRQLIGEIHLDIMGKVESEDLLQKLAKDREFYSKKITSNRIIVSSLSRN